jgi:hypothetical protein
VCAFFSSSSTSFSFFNHFSTSKHQFFLSSLDALDSEGVWNVARVLSIPSSEEVSIVFI